LGDQQDRDGRDNERQQSEKPENPPESLAHRLAWSGYGIRPGHDCPLTAARRSIKEEAASQEAKP
jgi:hypothetical protein